ncbi:MAG: type II toxin-antitoxin system HipA family toxin [Fimbriimonadales bacterium]
MTDFRSVAELQVFRGGEYVAGLRRLPKGCQFRYTDRFLASSEPPIALHLPKDQAGLSVEGLANLPTYFAGLLPEGVMLAAARRLIGAAADDLFAILAATGADAIGDIDVRVPGEPERGPALNLAEAANEIRALLSGMSKARLDGLTAISGAQPKLSLDSIVRSSRKSRYIAKFDSPEFPKLIENEFACMKLARRCGLDAAEVSLRDGALVVTRFDRIVDGHQVRKVHVEDLLQAMDLYPNSKYSLEFAELMNTMRRLGVSKVSLLDALRQYVFSYLIGNGDLHAKNLSLIFDGQWRLSPAYDLLSTLPYADLLPGADRMALALSNESYGRFTRDEFIGFGGEFDLPAPAVSGMIQRLCRAISNYAPGLAPASIVETVLERARSLQC